MKESDLYQPVKAWLENKGYVVYPEVGNIDIVALKGRVQTARNIIMVELKLSLNKRVIEQCFRNLYWTHNVYAAVSKTAELRIRHYTTPVIGLLHITDNSVNSESYPTFEYHPVCDKRCERLKLVYTDGVAGEPNKKGIGPAQDCYKRVLAYRERYPDATWKNIYNNVPNHYSSHSSMRNAMQRVQDIKLAEKMDKEIDYEN